MKPNDSHSDQDQGALLERFGDLAVWKRGAQRAPHKPLLVLLALGALERGERWLSFREVDEHLGTLLQQFGPPRKRHHPEYPFWRLQNDGVWTIPHTGPLARRQSNVDPLKSELLKKDVHGGFTGDVWDALRAHEELRGRIARLMLEEHFPQSLHEDLLSAVGLEMPTIGGRTERDRDPSFRAEVLRAYSYRCAVCGFDLKLDLVPLGLEAAHIQWHAAGGPDQVSNGLALCALHHKMLDRGAIHVTAGLRLLVSEAVHGSSPYLERLRARHGSVLDGPQRTAYYPEDDFVGWHLREVYRG